MEDLIEVGFWPRIKDKAIYPSGKKRFSGKLLDHVTADIYNCDFRYWHTYLDQINLRTPRILSFPFRVLSNKDFLTLLSKYQDGKKTVERPSMAEYMDMDEYQQFWVGTKNKAAALANSPITFSPASPPPLPVAPTPQPHPLHALLATQNSTTKSETPPPYLPTTHQHPHPHSLFPALASSSAASHPSHPAPSASPSPAQ